MDREHCVADYRRCQAITKDHYNLSDHQRYIEPRILEKNSRYGSFLYMTGTHISDVWYGHQSADEVEIDVIASNGDSIKMVEPGDVVLDCGAHTGFLSKCFALATGPSRHVIAFDPYPQNADLIEHNVILNGFKNVTVIQKALGSQARFLTLSQDHQGLVESDSNLVKTYEVTLDSYAFLRPTFLKLDVEGFEVGALMGAARILAGRPRLNIEVHGPLLHIYGNTVHDVIDLLPPSSEYRYYTRSVDPQTGLASGYHAVDSLDLDPGLFTTVLGLPKV